MTSHGAFNYFIKSYLAEEGEDWRIRYTAPEGLVPEGQICCVDISNTISYLKQYNVKYIFVEANINKDSINKILSVGNSMGLDLCIAKDILYSDTMIGDKNKEINEIGYITTIRHNANVIYYYLNKKDG